MKIFSYGVMVMLGFIAAVWWTIRAGARRGFSADTVMDAAVYIFIPAMVFARLLFVALNLGEYHSLAEVGMVWRGGMSFHGGLLGGVLGGVLFCWRRRIAAWDFADVASPGIALGYAIGRIGCLLNGCCYGRECTLPWAMRFPDPSTLTGLTPPSHPAQIYSSIAGLIMFAILARVEARRRFPGQAFLLFLILYSAYRFAIEYIRAGVTAQVAVDGETQAQIASVVIALCATVVTVARYRAAKRSEQGKAGT